MPRLHRPYIPLKVRVDVAQRQLDAIGANTGSLALLRSDGARLKVMLELLFNGRPSHLDHDPALENRRKYQRRVYPKDGGASVLKVFYDPPANDPNFLIYREGGKPGDGSEHDIKTRVRGPGARLSDHGEARKAKRVRKNRERGRGAAPVKFTQRQIERERTRRLTSRSSWPARGTRKVQWWKQ